MDFVETIDKHVDLNGQASSVILSFKFYLICALTLVLFVCIDKGEKVRFSV